MGMESPAHLLVDLQHVPKEVSTDKFPDKPMKRHLLRDLELGLQQPVQMLNPQGKERPSAREQKKLTALHVPSLMGTALWHLPKEPRAALLTR